MREILALEYLPKALGILLVAANWYFFPESALVWAGVLALFIIALIVSIRLSPKDTGLDDDENWAGKIRKALSTASWTIVLALIASLSRLVVPD